jgi:hypothetical protein
MSEELQAALDQLSTAQHHVSALQAERDSLQQVRQGARAMCGLVVEA